MELKPALTATWVPGALPRELADSHHRVVLLFGPDQGAVFEFARLVVRGAECERIDASGAEAPAVLSSLTSSSLFGGASSVRLGSACDRSLRLVEAALDADFADGARLVIEAGDLKPSSKLRKLVGGHPDGLAIPLYTLRDRELARFAKDQIEALGLRLEHGAIPALTPRLSGDRAAAARACEVVSLHALGRGARAVSALDAQALDEVDEDGLQAPLDHAIEGRLAPAVIAARRRLDAGESFVAMLRTWSARAFRLRALREAVEGPRPISARDAVAKAKPPVFWAERDRMTRLAGAVTAAKLDRVIEMIDRAEHRIIEQRIPEQNALAALLIDVSRHASWKDIA